MFPFQIGIQAFTASNPSHWMQCRSQARKNGRVASGRASGVKHLPSCCADQLVRCGDPEQGAAESNYFIVPKRDRRLHPVLDLRALNSALRKFRFKMLTTKLIASQIRSEDWFVTIDLKDAYFHLGIRPEHRKFLKFAFGGKVYQFQVLPFSLALLPLTFTKCMDAALALLRLQGIRVLNYLDDWLILAHSKAMAASHRDVLLAHMRSLGLRITPEKCVLSPSQGSTFLGALLYVALDKSVCQIPEM
ncbi:hypothetical protein QTP70_008698 [Hemibagrus guttatus]|uniref:ribonuclease H n=1 Tax=Hemibagrus guttatus TaxID=175788 RepID=A0AAE0V5H6_9TELE|nr:hypothetical protein QTP70_008698 [Hemibagrus guttatus]KAK3568530.1 hypothetical protein QTP86_008615 [Hemibagrus guttatus]